MKTVKKFRVFVFLILVVGLVLTLLVASMLIFKKGRFGSGGRQGLEKSVVIENQLDLPKLGEQIAVIDVLNYGIIKCRLFEEAAPKTVKNFVKLANAGSYDGLTFDRVITDLMIQCSDENEEVAKPKSIMEHNPSLHAYNGALCTVRSQDNVDDQTGQFSIICSEDGKRADFEYLESHRSEYEEDDGNNGDAVKFDEVVRNNYRKKGGFPIYDMLSTFSIFGQVYEGMDVVESIVNCPKVVADMFDGEESQPEKEIVISSIRIETVQEQDEID